MRQVQKGSTDVAVDVYIIDDTAGTPETAVVWNTSGMDLWYRREGAAKVSITEATLSALTDAHSDGGFLAISNGVYRLDVPDAAFATGASTVTIGGTVTGMIVMPQTIQLVDFDPEDSTRLGLTALPNAAADAAGGLAISDAGGADLDTLIANVAAVLVDTGTTLDGKINTIDTNVDSILADTGTDGVVLANDAITAAKIAADAIGSSELATTAVNEIRDAILDNQIADSVPADGTLATIEQAIYMILQFLTDKVTSGTDVSVKKVDGSTELFGLALDDATNPTSITRDA